MTTVQITPSATPLAITMPISRPSVRRMVHIARKPAMVVRLEAEMEVMVLQMALTMASSLVERSSFSSWNRCSRKMEKSIVTPSWSTVAKASVM